MTSTKWPLALLLLAAPAATAAQEGVTPTPTRVDSLAQVRVQQNAIPRRLAGTLVAADSHSVSLRTFADGEPIVVPLAGVRRMDVYRGRRTPREGAAHGAGRGLVVGLGASALVLAVGAGALLGGCGDCLLDPGTLVVGTVVPITLGTTAIGALLGAASPGEMWVRVRTPVVLAPPPL